MKTVGVADFRIDFFRRNFSKNLDKSEKQIKALKTVRYLAKLLTAVESISK